MKYTTSLLLSTIGIILSLSAQTPHRTIGKQSALTHQYIHTAGIRSGSTPNPKFVFSTIQNIQYVSAFIKVNDQLTSRDLDQLGILTGTKAGDIWTVKIPTDRVEALTEIKNGIDYIQLDQPVYPTMEAARAKAKVNAVHQGLDLPQAYTGMDVVMGIIDVGFDYTHPTFYDEAGVNNRIKRIWEQKSTGTPPAGYSYGHEIIDVVDMIARESDNAEQSHGTHVAGIAAGSGVGGEGTAYRGVAYESELVFVGITPAQEQWHNTGMTDIVDGINYVFDYAEAQGKPAVANLSWGCTVGPHDGSSLFSQAVNKLTGPGRLFTISAGNNGGQSVHLNKTFSDTDSLLQSIVKFSPRLGEKKTWLDVWGEPGETFCIQFGTYTLQTNNTNTGLMCVNDSTLDTFLIGSDNDTLFINVSTVTEELNGKPHAFIDIHSKTEDDISFSVIASGGEVNVWMGYVLESTGYYGFFTRNGVSGAMNGNDKMTIGEMACTASAITVGAYASKNQYTNVYGLNVSFSSYVNTDQICPFSSKGPAVNGRTKPDITAPGMTLASAVNSFDINFTPGGSSYESVVHHYGDTTNDRDYYYAELYGTSMSAPMVAGIIALYLQADPAATPEELISLMRETAITDDFTKDVPNAAIWGPGKINAHAMLQSLFVSGLDENITKNNLLYPNPTQDLLFIDVGGPKVITLTDAVGKSISRFVTNENAITLQHLKNGIYYVMIHNSAGELLLQEKIVKL